MTQAPNDWRRAAYVTAAIFIVFLLQHYFRRFGQPIEDIYFTIIFASIALTGLTLIAASYLLGPLARLWPSRFERHSGLRKQFGLTGLLLVVFHVVLALTVLTPAYFPKMFSENGKLSGLGQVSMLAGTAGFVLLIIVGITSLPSVAARMTERGWMFVQRFGLIAVILSVLHFAVFKWRGWLGPNWIHGIPPGTLVVTAFVIFVFLMRVAAYVKVRSQKN